MRQRSLVFLVALLGLTAAATATVIPAGNVSGLWNAAGSPYFVQGNIRIPAGAILSVCPGTRVMFDGPYALTVCGRLYALGTEVDSIFFTASGTEEQDRWHGIRLTPAEDTCRFRYCVIEHASSEGYSAKWLSGGGLAVNRSPVEVEHCALRGNFTIPADDRLGEFGACVSAGPAADAVVTNITGNVLPNPADFELLPNYPNPFNSSTVFTWIAPAAATVRLVLFNALGEQMAVVFDGSCRAGVNALRFDANRLPTGVYFARLEADNRFISAHKILLLK